MTKLIALLTLLTLSSFAGIAQNKGTLKGKIVDSLTHEPMEFATVAVLNVVDSSLLSYTLTVKGGAFALHNLPAEKDLKLLVSFIGYSNFRRMIYLNKGATLDLGTIKLNSKVSNLSEVKITAEAPPIIVKKDTIEFNAEAFKTPPNAVVEELLKRLPGIQVDMDGTISMNGKKISKIKIDGKEFFTNDPRIASRNLDANMVDKVQVYDDREDDPDHLIPDAKVNKIINLKLKNAIKKSTFGKLHGGAGTRDRFDGGVLYNMFRDTLQVSLIGIANNLNHTGFSTQDLTNLGGFNRSGTDALYNGSIATGGKSYGGIETVAAGGANVNNDYGKKLKLNFLYYYGYTRDVYDSHVFTQQLLNDTTLNTTSTNQQNRVTNTHNISSLVEWNPDTAVKIRYQPHISFNTGYNTSLNNNTTGNNFIPLLNINDNTADNHTNSFQFQQSFSYYRNLGKKDASLTISHNLNISPNSGLNYKVNNFTSFTQALPSSDLNRLENTDDHSDNAGLNITYRYPLSKKLIGDVVVSGNYTHNNGQFFVYNENLQTGRYDMYIDSLSRNLNFRQFTETIRPELTYNINKQTMLIANLGVQFSQVYNQFNKNVPDINRFETYLLPSLTFYNNKLSINYDVSVTQPPINNLLPYTTFYSQLYSAIGNPALKPTRTHSFYAYYYDNKTERMLNMNAYSGFSFDENSVFNETTVSGEGATIARPVNKTGGFSTYLGINIGKGFKKFNNWQIRSNTRINESFRHSFFQVNNQEGFQNSQGISVNEQVFVNWNNKFEINPSYTINNSITNYQFVNYNAVKYTTQSLNLPINIRWIKRTTFEANYSYAYNPLVGQGFQRSINILNLSLARQFQYRDRGEIKISCYDLLDQNVSNYQYVNGNSIGNIQSQILRRYFLLSYSYRFNKVTSKK